MTDKRFQFLKSWKFWAAILCGWTLYGVLEGQESYAYAVARGNHEYPLTAYIVRSFPLLWQWCWAMPLTMVLARRFPLSRSAWIRPLAVHLVCAVAVAGSAAAGDWLLLDWLSTPPMRSFVAFILFQLDPGLFLYFAILGLVHAVDFYRLYASERIAAATLRADLSDARLQVLSAQLHPHFLFNTLNVISELVHEDPDRADDMIERLGDLLRESMSEEIAAQGGVPLERELATLQAYVDIQQVRFRDRLDVSFDVADAVRHARLPHFVLQPLVENAILHGSAGSRDHLRVWISAEPEGNRVRIRVADDGRGIGSGSHRRRKGLGLRTVHARLGNMFGSDYSLTLNNREPQGVAADVSIPFRAATLTLLRS